MPWIPELFSERVLEEWRERYARQRIVDVPFMDGLLAGEPDALVGAFAGEPLIFHPFRGRIRGEWELRAFAAEAAGWMRSRNAKATELLHVVGPRRGFEEVVLSRPDGGGESLPIGLVADHADGTHLDEIRIYFSTHQLLGLRTTRQPLLQVDPRVELPPVIAEHLRALAEGDVDGAAGAYAKGATMRMPDGTVEPDPRTWHADVARAGGVDLDTCAACGDGRHVAVEYNVQRLADTSVPPQAGMVVHDLEPGGARIKASRIYDDIERPRLSQP